MKKAFTMIELVFVIVVIGILAATIIPSTKTNPVQEAAVQMLSHIRYVQHLAIVDDVYENSTTDWKKGYWQMVFTSSEYAKYKYSYTIFADKDFGSGYGGDATVGEIARNPENHNQLMTGGYGIDTLDIREDGFVGMRKLNLGLSYGITAINRTGGCNNLFHLSFDSFGRPIKGTHNTTSNSQSLITSDCFIELTDGSESVKIKITPETGYACVLNSTQTGCL